ncbi:hypothetical protein ACLMJK_006576 [Lecanora helva]
MRRSSNGLGDRSRKDTERASLMGPIPLGHNTPTSFRLTRDEDLESSSPPSKPSSGSDSTFGVHSLPDTICDSQSSEKHEEQDSGSKDETTYGGRRRSTLRPMPHLCTRESSPESSEEKAAVTDESSPSHHIEQGPSLPSMSHSMTSLSLDSQAPLSSLPSTPKSTSNQSLRPSDEESMDEGASQAIASSEDEVEPQEVHDSAPQLIMPSIKMPSRRPFTEQGKAMGRFKVLIAGDSGVGKTSLIKSIVQTCEAIVHVDPLSPNLPSIAHPSSTQIKSTHNNLKTNPTQQITEVYASTKPYPPWWSDIEDTKILLGRKSMGDTVLERNICFVDTPGYSNGIPKTECMQLIYQYVEAQLSKPFSALTASEGNFAGLLSGSGGSQVDVVFYLIEKELEEDDTALLRRLATITNVIPLVARSDTQSFEEAEMLRRSVDLVQQDIGFFTFKPERSSLPYAVSSAPADDNDTMDASTLMSPDYVQPLLPSELSMLVEQVFNPDRIACLRHLAAKKLVHAKGSDIFTRTIISPPNPDSPSPKSRFISNTSHTMIPYSRRLSPYIEAQVSDHSQQQERLAHIRLAKWAGDLQRSLQNERARYEATARDERAVWLKERLKETAEDGALVSTQRSTTGAPITNILEAGRRPSPHGFLDASDPLGLLKWNEVMKRRGWIAVQVIGSFGVFGAMAVWAARTWGASYLNWHWSELSEYIPMLGRAWYS